MGIRAKLSSAKVWLANKGWSIGGHHDYGPIRRYGLFSVLTLRVHWARGDYVSVSAAIAGLHVEVTKYARGGA